MEVKKERVIGYCLAVIFLVVGIVCYAAFPQKAPDEPIRIMFTSSAGNILFDHKGHASETGYGIDCGDCHHDDADEPAACGECHDEPEEDVAKRSDAFHTQCIGCHEDEDAGPMKCAECHVL